MAPDEILAAALALGRQQPGGTLSTVHAEDATPYVTFVLFHLRESGELLFASSSTTQHSRNIAATPEVSFLVDNREVITTDWTYFDRVVIEGRASRLDTSDPEHGAFVAEFCAKSPLHEANYQQRQELYRIRPGRLLLARGAATERHVIDFRHRG